MREHVKKKKPNIVAVIQARMGSTRLPGKILMEIAGVPMLARVVQRVQRAKNIGEVIVATTEDPDDDVVVQYCIENGFLYIRGEREDVLRRYLKAAHVSHADVIVRITADCPLMDPDVIDQTVQAFLEEYPQVSFGSNRGTDDLIRTYPIGMDVEVMITKALERADLEATQTYQREHVTPYFYETTENMRKTTIHANGQYGDQRWAVDTAEDLAFVREIYAHFSGRDDFGFDEVIELLEREPALLEINAHVRQKAMREAG